MSLVAGWQDSERNAITSLLEEIRPLAAHNADVYQQASLALAELSKQQAESRRLKDEAEEARDEATALQEKVSAEIAEARAKMTIDREDFDAECRTRTKAIEECERELDQGKASLDGRKAEIDKAADQAQGLKQAADEALARVAAREKEATDKIRTLREALA